MSSIGSAEPEPGACGKAAKVLALPDFRCQIINEAWLIAYYSFDLIAFLSKLCGTGDVMV